MKYLVILLTILSFGITQCGGDNAGSSFGTQSGNGEKKETEPTTTTYQGDVKKIHFFDGGWYGPYPNYNIDLILEVNAQGLIEASLDIPTCQLKAQLDVASFTSLTKTLKEAPLKDPAASFPIPIDAGEKYISVTTKAEGNKKGDAVKTYLNRGIPQYTDAFAKNIEDSLLKLADQMMETVDCSESDIQVLEITERRYRDLTHATRIDDSLDRSSLPIDPRPKTVELARDLKITLVNGQYVLNGSEEKNQLYGGCTRQFNDVILPNSVVDSMYDIDFAISEIICMYQPIDGSGLHMTATLENGKTRRGSAGCWNRLQIQNHQAFMKGLATVMEKTQPTCWAY